jgi:transcriptional regulator with XRE-family HTH domain
MAPRRDSSALRWLLGIMLRDSRNKANKTLAQAASAIDGSPSKVSNMESGRYYQAPDDIARLLDLYEVPKDDADHVLALIEREGERAWWQPWHDVVPPWLQTFIGLEGFATSLFTYEPLVMPALLQTAEYAVVTTDSPRVRRDAADRVVSLRMERQRRLLRDKDPLELHAVIEESVLHRPVGNEATMQAQLRHLVEMSQRPNVTLQVIPTSVGVHAAFTGKFDLLSFEEFGDVVYVELMETAVYLPEPDKARAYRLSAESLRNAALSQRESLALITSLVGEY